jgi:hypothetical protein
LLELPLRPVSLSREASLKRAYPLLLFLSIAEQVCLDEFGAGSGEEIAISFNKPVPVILASRYRARTLL